MAKLTVKALEALRLEHVGQKMRDDGGLIGLVRPNGVAVSVKFTWRYRFDKKVREVSVGTWPKMSLMEIRNLRDKLKVDLTNGVVRRDVVAERKAMQEAERLRTQALHEAELLRIEVERQETLLKGQQRLEELAVISRRITVSDLFERWSSVDLVRRKDNGAEIRRMFEKDVLPSLGTMAVEDVRKGHITGVTDALLARGVNRMAKMIFSLMRQMFRFAVDRDIIEFEPSAAIRKAKIGGKDTERDRVLSEDEIKALWRQLPKAGMSDSAVTAVWLALATCCRIGELMAARWEHIDFEQLTWWIPAENSKNGRAHTVNLSAFAFEQFRTLKGIAEEGEAKARSKNPNIKPVPWVYPNRHNSGPVCPKTVTKQLGDRQRPGMTPMKGRAKAELADTLVLIGGRWGPHDLRRTGATMMVALGVLPEVAERCLNHTEQNRVKRTYQRHSYENEMREAWRLLGDRLDLLLRDAGNVITADFSRTAA